MTKQDILKILKEEKSKLAKEYFIRTIGLFGSFATQTNSEKSDVDIVFEMEQGHFLGFDDKLKLENFSNLNLEERSIWYD